MFLGRKINMIKLSILSQIIWNLIKMKPLLLDKQIFKFIWKNKQVGRQFSMGFSCFWVRKSSDYLCSRQSLQGYFYSKHTCKIEIMSVFFWKKGKFVYCPVKWRQCLSFLGKNQVGFLPAIKDLGSWNSRFFWNTTHCWHHLNFFMSSFGNYSSWNCRNVGTLAVVAEYSGWCWE